MHRGHRESVNEREKGEERERRGRSERESEDGVLQGRTDPLFLSLRSF